MSIEEKGSAGNKLYFSIIDGSFRTTVPSTHPEAVERKWEVGKDSGVKYERVVRTLSGRITNMYISDHESDGRKFTKLNIVLDENEQGKVPVIGVALNNPYGRMLLRKLPAVDFEKDVKFRPYSFTEDGSIKPTVGIELLQQTTLGEFTVKVQSHFTKRNSDGTVESVNGMPTTAKPYGDMSETERKIYYLTVDEFLVTELKKLSERFVAATPKVIDNGHRFEADSINPDDIPF